MTGHRPWGATFTTLTALLDAFVSGVNPYTSAVTIPDGNPFAPDDSVIEGYAYPPVVLVTYGLAGALSDPRLTSAAAWLAFVGWLAWGAASLRRKETSVASLSFLLLLSAAPLVSEVWYMAWTEPLSLILFLVATLTWSRSDVWSGVLLGLAVASKQYFVFLLPLLLFHRDAGWRRRSSVAVATAALTILVGFLPDPASFSQATIGNLVGITFRPDTQSLPGLAGELGLDFLAPTLLWIVGSFAVAVVLARSSTTAAGFIMRSGLTLGIAFWFGMAFPNYWFLVAGLLVIGSVLEASDDAAIRPGQFPVVGSAQGRRQETRIAGV